jgi:hypothetical protein
MVVVVVTVVCVCVCVCVCMCVCTREWGLLSDVKGKDEGIPNKLQF